MIDKFCDFLVNKIRREDPDIDDERAEVIKYGIQLIVGEIPKLLLLFVIGFALGIGKLTFFSFLLLLPYKSVSGGFHLKTHIGCIIMTPLIYCGTVFISKYVIISNILARFLFILGTWVFGMIMIKLYAPADTENVPIISLKERKNKKILSYITFSILMILAIVIPDMVISNICLYGGLLQSFCISRLAYIITNNKYGHETYQKAAA